MLLFADIVLVAGSPSPLSRSAAALEYVAYSLHQAQQPTITLLARDLVATALVAPIPSEHTAVQHAVAAIENARAVVVATPIYNAAYSGVLKTFLDFLPQHSLSGKIVVPIATGGSLAHLLAIDYALKPVLSALGARHILQSSYLTDEQIARVPANDTGYSRTFRIDESGEKRLSGSVRTLLENLEHTDPHPRANTATKDIALAG